MEVFGLIFLYGFVLGAIQSYTRTCFTDIVPPGQESEFFGIYEISDKGSSWLGPLICGVLYEATGTMRPAFFYLFFMSCLGWYLVYITDMEEGAEACRRKEIQVRMEAVRKKLGVSKIQIQMNAKKFLGVKSSTASGASSVASSASTSSVESAGKEKSVIEMTKEEVGEDIDIVNAPIDNLLQRASIINKGDGVFGNMPARKNSMFALRTRTSGATNARSARESGGDSSGGERSARSTRKSSLLIISEVTKAGIAANIDPAKIAPAN